jgi:hypothetical protein
LLDRILMTDPSSFHRGHRILHHHQTGWGAVLLGFAIFGLLWALSSSYRQLYVPNNLDIPALADGLLLAPGARWVDWFTRGYSNFWNAYPEWPMGTTFAFTRPAFQFVIYLAHFAIGRNWQLYQIISCFAVAAMAAVAFIIARSALGLRTGLSLLAAVLVVLSPPVVDCWQFGLSDAHEPLATVLVASAFLAVVARRDILCLTLLFVAVLTKETAVWAPAAAAITIMLRPKPNEALRRQAIAAAAMFLPVVFWLGLRFTFFGGIAGTYATAGYTPLGDFLALTFKKLKTLDTLFVGQHAFATEGHGALLVRAIGLGTRLLTYALFSLLAVRIVREIASSLRYAMYKRSWPTVDAAFLVSLWAAIALAFYFALAMGYVRYATSVVVFAWPALVAEIERRRRAIIWLGLAVVCVVLSVRSYLSVELVSFSDEFRPMRVALHQVPVTTRQVYILQSYTNANPEYLRLILGVPAEIVNIINMYWNCGESNNLVAFDHSIADGVVKLTVTLPACAYFTFFNAPIGDKALAHGRLYRNNAMSYELPEVEPVKGPWQFFAPMQFFGRRMTVHVRPNGPARFIIQQGGPNGIAWFDTP